MIVFDVYIGEMYRCPCILEVNLYAVIRNAYRPEQSAWSDSRVEVVNLIRRSNLPLIQIQSYETESAEVLFPIQPIIHTLDETHVSVEGKGSSNTSLRVCSYTRPVDNSGSDCAMKIEDG